jgi:predicted restriction endonuclease
MKTIEKTCLTCNNTFNADTREHNRGNAKYCSLSCVAKQQVNKIKNINSICIYCQTTFLSGSKESKYCSNSCKQKYYRKTQVTNEFATKSLQRILGHLPCELCGWDTTTRDVHHILPVNEGGKNTLDNVIVVCPNHHRMYHKQLISEEATSAALKLRLSLHPYLYKEQDALAGN